MRTNCIRVYYNIFLCTAKFKILYPSYNDKNIEISLLVNVGQGIHGIHFTGPAEANAFYSSYLNTRAQKEKEEHGSAPALFYFARRHEKRAVFIF